MHIDEFDFFLLCEAFQSQAKNLKRIGIRGLVNIKEMLERTMYMWLILVQMFVKFRSNYLRD